MNTTTKHPSPKPATPATARKNAAKRQGEPAGRADGGATAPAQADAARISAAAGRRAQALSATADAWRHVAISSGDAVDRWLAAEWGRDAARASRRAAGLATIALKG